MARGTGELMRTHREIFDSEIEALDTLRGPTGRLLTAYYKQTQDSVFDAYTSAQQDVEAATPRMHVVSAPVGSGKTSAGIALIAAHVKSGEQRNGVPGTALLVVNQVLKADETYRDLVALLGRERVSVWTQEHDTDKPVPEDQRKLSAPSAKFSKHDLQNYPVAIVTHRMFSDKNRTRASVMADGTTRTLTVIDESMDEVEIYDCTFADVAAVREAILAAEGNSSNAATACSILIEFMHERGRNNAPKIDKPSADDIIKTYSVLSWFKSPEGRTYASRSKIDGAAAVFGFARCLLDGYSFILKGTEEDGNTRYIGYENRLALDPGTILLDATADIDGVQQLVLSDRSYRPVPRADYKNLQVVITQPPTKQRLSKFLAKAPNAREHVSWMLETIKRHMTPGQRGLVVCSKKWLIDQQHVPAWPAGDKRFLNPEKYMEDYGWNVDGRHLSVTSWGNGIGSNTWQDADIVFLFDMFYRPVRVTIGTTQGLRRANNTQGPLAALRAQNARHPDIDAIDNGWLLRWNKQMALRGNARQFDAYGVCGKQKLVCATTDTRILLANLNVMFPGAQIEVATASKKPSVKQTDADQLLTILSRPNLPDTLTTKRIGQQMKKPWREVGKHVMKIPEVQRAVENLGWEYKPVKGRTGGAFVKIGEEDDRAAVLEAPMAA
jgi:hypothetical protein